MEEAINTIPTAPGNIHISRIDEIGKTTEEKTWLLHFAPANDWKQLLE